MRHEVDIGKLSRIVGEVGGRRRLIAGENLMFGKMSGHALHLQRRSWQFRIAIVRRNAVSDKKQLACSFGRNWG